MSQPARRAGEPTACERSLWRLCTADNHECQRTALSPQDKQMQSTPKAGTLRQSEAQERGPDGRPRASQLATALVRAARACGPKVFKTHGRQQRPPGRVQPTASTLGCLVALDERVAQGLLGRQAPACNALSSQSPLGRADQAGGQADWMQVPHSYLGICSGTL